MELSKYKHEDEVIYALEGTNINEPLKHLYTHYLSDVVSFIISKGGSEQDGNDIFQDSILLLIEKIKKREFRKESSLKSFLIGIAKNLWLADLRRRDRRKDREEGFSENHEISESPEVWRNKQKGVEDLFEKMDETCKNILFGFYFENKNMKTLLKEFDFKNEQVLRNRKAICMKKLKEMLSENIELKKLLLNTNFYD